MNFYRLLYRIFPPAPVRQCLGALKDLSQTRHSWAILSLSADSLFKQITPEIEAIYLDPRNLNEIQKSLCHSSPREAVLYTFCIRLEQIVGNGELAAYETTFSQDRRSALSSLHSVVITELTKIGFCTPEDGSERCANFGATAKNYKSKSGLEF